MFLASLPNIYGHWKLKKALQASDVTAEERAGQHASLVYYASVLITFIVLIIFYATRSVLIVREVKRPTLAAYEEFLARAASEEVAAVDVLCDCDQQQFSLDSFSSIDYANETICAGIERLVEEDKDAGDIYSQYKIAQLVCRESSDVFHAALESLRATVYVTPRLNFDMQTRVERDLQEPMRATMATMRRLRRLVELITVGEGVVTTWRSGLLNEYTESGGAALLAFSPTSDALQRFQSVSCDCYKDSSCKMVLEVEDNHTQTFLCSALESILSYDAAFLQWACEVRLANVSAGQYKLESSNSLGFAIDSGMTKNYSASFSFHRYYDACSVAQCRYNAVAPLDWTALVTTAIGLVGGLTSILSRVIEFIWLSFIFTGPVSIAVGTNDLVHGNDSTDFSGGGGGGGARSNVYSPFPPNLRRKSRGQSLSSNVVGVGSGGGGKRSRTSSKLPH